VLERDQGRGGLDRACAGIELAARTLSVNKIAPGAVETEGAHGVGMIGSDFE
jgi:hypothetical protein